MGLLDGKVVVVTGAGGGLGRTHALAFAKEGASVVVNDLGGSRDGSGGGSSMAEKVVAEITQMGGKAVANFDSVSDPDGAERIIQSAVKAFGRLDVLVNNAGILRDKTLLKMTNEEWKPVIAVHLDGTFYCGRAAAKYMSENKIAGHIINTTSYSGLKGNYGQGNYGAAKSGVVALTKIWGMELAKYGITVNAIAPMAKTRMTEDIAAVPDDTQPEHISPLVVFLGSDLSKDVTGRIFGCHGRHYFEYKLELTEGVKKDSDWTVQEIASKLEAISASASAPSAAAPAAAAPASGGGTVQDRIRKAFGLMETAFTPDKAAGWNAVIQFAIEGADNYTIVVNNKTVAVQPGLTGTATCKVNVSADTMAGMIEGKISGQSAFMAGKIKATNLGDMMKFGKVFDFKRAREAAGASTASASAPAAASAGGDSLQERIRMAFGLMETAFTPDKAAGWNAVIQFLVEGADSYTIEVKDKTVAVRPGVSGTPTCKVNISADTMAGMIEGKVSGQSAFMAGKIKATNLGDMMKFGKVFDFKRAREVAAKGGAPAATTSSPAAASAPSSVSLSAVFEKLSSVFQPEATAGWNGKIAFDVQGSDGYTVAIENKACTITPSKQAGAICTITAQSADLVDVLTGKSDFKTAMSQGKVKASNPMALVKLNQAFNWKGLSAALAAATPSSAGDASSGGVSPSIVGRKYRSQAVFVRPEHIRKYAAATNDPNALYKASSPEKELVAPPIFPVTLVGDLFKQMLGDDTGIDMSRMVHGEQTITYYDVLRPWDLVSPRGVISKVERKGNNDIVTFDQYLYRDGDLVTKISSALFVRGTGGSKSSTEEKKASPPSLPNKPVFSYGVTVAGDQPTRYADASGDNNPIHLDVDIAKAAGFPGVILHGLCTMAFAGQAVVEKLLGGDLRQLKELSVRFSKPVLPGDTLTFAGEVLADKSGFSFIGANGSGVAVLTQGVAKVGPDALKRYV